MKHVAVEPDVNATGSRKRLSTIGRMTLTACGAIRTTVLQNFRRRHCWRRQSVFCSTCDDWMRRPTHSHTPNCEQQDGGRPPRLTSLWRRCVRYMPSTLYPKPCRRRRRRPRAGWSSGSGAGETSSKTPANKLQSQPKRTLIHGIAFLNNGM